MRPVYTERAPSKPRSRVLITLCSRTLALFILGRSRARNGCLSSHSAYSWHEAIHCTEVPVWWRMNGPRHEACVELRSALPVLNSPTRPLRTCSRPHASIVRPVRSSSKSADGRLSTHARSWLPR
ncbi:hypothetical protein OH77DRAFT_559829 [Trametes cingulata]|nr:hypothetical protein OH77DRAFT_559829 [Trametes cingulata]